MMQEPQLGILADAALDCYACLFPRVVFCYAAVVNCYVIVVNLLTGLLMYYSDYQDHHSQPQILLKGL